MSLLKVSDNYSANIVGNFLTTDTELAVDVEPVKTSGYLTAFDLNGNQYEKIKYTGYSSPNLTGCIRGLSFDEASDTPVVGNAKELKNGMQIKMTVSQAYLNPVIDFVNQYDGKWMGAVADYATLAALVGSEDGEARVTLDDSKLYIYDTTTSAWILAGAGGGAGTVYVTTKLGTEAEGDDNQTFELNSGSFPDKKYLQVYKNGVLQEEGATEDYVATGSNQAVFNVAVDDADKVTLLVVSVDLYNPAWNSVDDDILPDVDNSYDIGSTTKKFKDAHLSGDANVTGNVDAATFSGDGTDLDDGANKLASGTGANDLVRLDGDAKLPAIDGSALTNLEENVALGLYELVASETLKTSDDSDETTTETTYTKIKEIEFNYFYLGTIRVKFSWRNGSGGGNVSLALFKNGIKIGSDLTTSSTTYVLETDDISIERGDLIQIYGKQNNSPGIAVVKEFRLYYDLNEKYLGTDVVN